MSRGSVIVFVALLSSIVLSRMISRKQVVGIEPLDELEAMQVKLFSAVEDRSVTAPTWPEYPFPPPLRRKRAYCTPVKDLRSLSIDFPIPDTRKHDKSGVTLL